MGKEKGFTPPFGFTGFATIFGSNSMSIWSRPQDLNIAQNRPTARQTQRQRAKRTFSRLLRTRNKTESPICTYVMFGVMASLNHKLREAGECCCFQLSLLGSADAVVCKPEPPQIAKPWQRCGQRRSSTIPNAVAAKDELLQVVDTWQRLGQRRSSTIPNAVVAKVELLQVDKAWQYHSPPPFGR